MFEPLIEYLVSTNPAIIAGFLAFIAIIFVGLSILFLREQRRHRVRRRLEPEVFHEKDRSSQTPRSKWMLLFERIGNFVSHGHASTSLWEQLIRAGYMNRGAPAVYTGIKIILFLLSLAVMAILVLPSERSLSEKTWLISCGCLVPFFLPNLYIMLRERKRAQEIQHYLPDVVDLLEICVSSGIGLDMAWNMVAADIHNVSSVLGTSMDLTNFEMHLGASRNVAMRNMAKRTGAKQLASLAAILVQSERFGTSIASALREFAISMREERRMTAEENAEKMAVKLIIPMVLFIFPTIIVVTIGPAVINIYYGMFAQ
ncbi:type II secretion system F family protein [Planctomycetota bacterium]